MATENIIQNLISRGLTPQEAGLYAYFAPTYNKPGMSISDLVNTIYLNHFSPQANFVSVQGIVADGSQFKPVGNIQAGTVPNGYSPNNVTDGPVIRGGVQNISTQQQADALTATGRNGGLISTPASSGLLGLGSSGGTAPGNTTSTGVAPTTNTRALPPAQAPAGWGGTAQTTPASGGSAGAQPIASGAYSSPWQMGGAWAGVTSHPQYGKGLLGVAGGTASPAQQFQQAAIERAKAAYGSGSGGQDGVAANVLDGGSGGQYATVGTPIDGTQQTFRLPGSPDYTSRQFLQTYNGQAAPYANEHQQLFDAMRGVTPLVPSFANYGLPQNGAHFVSEAATQGSPSPGQMGAPQYGGLLGTLARYFPGVKS
jgi:hypothetical protein